VLLRLLRHPRWEFHDPVSNVSIYRKPCRRVSSLWNSLNSYEILSTLIKLLSLSLLIRCHINIFNIYETLLKLSLKLSYNHWATGPFAVDEGYRVQTPEQWGSKSCIQSPAHKSPDSRTKIPAYRLTESRLQNKNSFSKERKLPSLRRELRPWPCLVHPEIQKLFKILRHIESCDICMKY